MNRSLAVGVPGATKRHIPCARRGFNDLVGCNPDKVGCGVSKPGGRVVYRFRATTRASTQSESDGMSRFQVRIARTVITAPYSAMLI